jgi:hypothetical protein
MKGDDQPEEDGPAQQVASASCDNWQAWKLPPPRILQATRRREELYEELSMMSILLQRFIDVYY